MKPITIDINCDVGEGVGNEAFIFPYISSCNIACGGHAGDQNSMLQIVKLAKIHKLRIGAHPSYPDKLNFGRESMKLDAGDLIKSIQAQIASLVSVLKEQQVSMHHIKPHGALYNDIAVNKERARLFLLSVETYKKEVVLYVPNKTIIAEEAIKQGFRICYEAFGDRNYTEKLKLVSRNLPNALITDPKLVLNHMLEMIEHQRVTTIAGSKIPILADTYCIHGDTPTAYQILMYLSVELPKRHIQLKK